MTKEQVIQGYLMNSPKVVAEMLYNTIEKYENRSCENRSCDNCKFKYVVDSMTTECQHNDSPIDYVDLDCFPTFSCNVWESK